MLCAATAVGEFGSGSGVVFLGEALDTVRSEDGFFIAAFRDASSIFEILCGRTAIDGCLFSPSKFGCVVDMMRCSVGIRVGTTCDELLVSMVLRGMNDQLQQYRSEILQLCGQYKP